MLKMPTAIQRPNDLRNISPPKATRQDTGNRKIIAPEIVEMRRNLTSTRTPILDGLSKRFVITNKKAARKINARHIRIVWAIKTDGGRLGLFSMGYSSNDGGGGGK